MYKVFFNESCFLLCDDSKFIKNKSNVFVYQNIISLQEHILNCLKSNQPFQSIIYAPKLDLLFHHFCAIFHLENAAGGVVEEDRNLLIINRLGMYDLPKGHVENGESLTECAIREVKEECGVKNPKIVKPFGDTWHIYYRNKQWNLKHTHWYLMSCPLSDPLEPQKSEDIEDVFWAPIYDLSEIKSKTYPSLLKLFEMVENPI